MRTLIIRPAALGDTLMLAPALSNSREWGEVIVVGRKPGIDFLRPLSQVVWISKAQAGIFFSWTFRSLA